MTSRISVLIPTYNRAKFLAASVESVLEQTVRPFQVIVIDDGSADETAQIVRQYGDQLLYLPKQNGGKSTALNLGLQAVHGDYVWIMDDDDVGLPDALERLLAPLEADRSLGMSFGAHLIAHTQKDGSLGQPVERTLPNFPDSDLFLALTQHGNLLGQAAFLTRATVCEKVGPYNTDLLRSQDFEMVLRLSAACRAVRVPGPLYIYRQHSDARGNHTARHNEIDRPSKWRHYDKIVYRRILQDIPLTRYLPAAESVPLSDFSIRRAHLQRMAMLWRGGLFEEVLKDLAQAVKIPGPLSTEEQRIFSGKCYPFDKSDEQWDAAYIRKIRLLTSGKFGRQIRLLLAQSIYWRMRLDFAERRYQLAWLNWKGFGLLLGWTGIPTVIAYKFGKMFGNSTSTVRDSVDVGFDSSRKSDPQ